MLTSDLAVVRRRGNDLHPGRLKGRARELAIAHAEGLLSCAKELVGGSREELEEAFAELEDDGLQKKILLGLRKLVTDACTFEAEPPVAASEVRERVFLLASERRRALEEGVAFDRSAVLRDAAAALDLTEDEVEAALFADLRGAQKLLAAPTASAGAIVSAWEVGQIQAILLRATRVVISIERASPGALRALLSRVKFHGLCWVAGQREDKAIELTIDGPMSLFDSVTKYGLRLAMLVPQLAELDAWSLVAHVRWGREREEATLRVGPADLSRERAPADATPHLSDTASELLADLEALAGEGEGLRVGPARVVLDVPGIGITIPDLVLQRDGWREPVYVEVLGFWSRDAVWKRVELVQAGLSARVVLCVSERLRVSEAVLDEDHAGALHVFKGKPRARAVLEHADRLAARR